MKLGNGVSSRYYIYLKATANTLNIFCLKQSQDRINQNNPSKSKVYFNIVDQKERKNYTFFSCGSYKTNFNAFFWMLTMGHICCLF